MGSAAAQFYFAALVRIGLPGRNFPIKLVISQTEAELPRETDSNPVRILIPQPRSSATPTNFQIAKLMPSFPPVGGGVRRADQKKMPICSTLLPIFSASLQSAFSDFPISPAF
jgi:hypothetical protein